jgi:hypothetical protein
MTSVPGRSSVHSSVQGAAQRVDSEPELKCAPARLAWQVEEFNDGR